MSAPRPSGERQEHLGAIVAFACSGQRRRLFRILDIWVAYLLNSRAAETLLLIGTHDPADAAEFNVSTTFSLEARKAHRSGRSATCFIRKRQAWYLDDGDILCRPVLVFLHLQAYDMANAINVPGSPTENRSHLLRLRPGHSSS